jgi:glucose-1-phosphate thymidylyltransferase
VANRPILFYVLDTLVDAGITDIGVVVSPDTGDEIRARLGDGSLWGARLRFIVQDHAGGIAHAAWIARDYLAGDDVCIALGDNLVGSKIRGAVEIFRGAREFEASVLLKEVSDPRAFGVAEIDAQGNVVRFVEKPDNPPSHLALVGIYLFRPSLFDAIARITPSARGELEITDALTKLLEQGKRVRFERLESWWLDTGKKDDLLLANQTVLGEWLVHAVHGQVCRESALSGRVRVEEGAVVLRSTIQGPVIIGRSARLEDARIGPFTSIGDGCVVVRSRIERSVMLEGSHVEDVERLEDSLVGRRVTVCTRGEGREALSLLVGDDSHIELRRG